ncbi:type II toxin-antitoxin system HicA family toxin, partial [Frankia sp. AvcI1]
MPPLPVLSGGEVVKVLEKLDFEVVRIKGSHHMMRNAEG